MPAWRNLLPMRASNSDKLPPRALSSSAARSCAATGGTSPKRIAYYRSPRRLSLRAAWHLTSPWFAGPRS
jgi:hypothetical protein